MSQCKLCETKGFFLIVSRDGLCETCERVVSRNLVEWIPVMNECMKVIGESKDMETRLSHCDLLIEHAEALLEYECKGIPTIEPMPSELVTEYTTVRDLAEGETEEVETALAKTENSTTLRKRLHRTDKVLLKVREGKQQLRDQGIPNQLKAHAQLFPYESQLSGYLEEASKAEFKEQIKAALNQYEQALSSLCGIEIDESLSGGKIAEIETRNSERIRVEMPVSFHIGRHNFFGSMANLSDDGMMIESSLAPENARRIFMVLLKTNGCPTKVNYSIKGKSFSRPGKIKHYHLDFSGHKSACRFSFGVWIPKLKMRDEKGL